jgi:hypothetical protein
MRDKELDTATQIEINDLERAVTSIEKILNKSGTIRVTDFGIWGMSKDEIIPLGYNPWLEIDGTEDVGMPREPDKFRAEGTDLVFKGIDAPEGFWDSPNRGKVITRNRRGILQKFGAGVYVFKDRIELRGLIPTHVLGLPGDKSCSGPDLSPALRRENRGSFVYLGRESE